MSETSAMIRRLAAEAGQPAGPALSVRGFAWALAVAAIGALAIGILLICVAFAGTFDAARVVRSYPFHFKIVTMALLALGGFLALRHQGVPGSDRRASLAILPGIAVLALLALCDRSGFPVLGRDALSVPICYLAVSGASLPALAALFAVLRRGVVTRPMAAGAAAGLLAGALGAMAYAIACKNNGALFVFIWYGLAIASVTALGAALGRRFLRW